MKLSKKLIASGVLGHGRVRHYSDWDLEPVVRRPGFGVHPDRRLLELRRRAAAGRRRGFLSFPLFGGKRGK